jgi:transcriptional regulator with XRE-family HTH domain
MARLDEKEIISKIRSLRKSKGVTLEKLAKRAGLTKGYLSQIEGSSKTPPFSTLDSNETEQEDANIVIVRPEERKKIDPGGLRRGYGYESLAYKKKGKNMEPYLITTLDSHPTGTFKHDGEEFIHILEGVMEFNYGGRKYILKKGDSVYFDSGIEHSTTKVLGDGHIKMLSVIYNYRRQ